MSINPPDPVALYPAPDPTLREVVASSKRLAEIFAIWKRTLFEGCSKPSINVGTPETQEEPEEVEDTEEFEGAGEIEGKEVIDNDGASPDGTSRAELGELDALASRYLACEEELFDELYTKSKKLVYRTIRLDRLPGHDTAWIEEAFDDAMQDVARSKERGQQFSLERGSWRSYVVMKTKSHLLSNLRRRRLQSPVAVYATPYFLEGQITLPLGRKKSIVEKVHAAYSSSRHTTEPDLVHALKQWLVHLGKKAPSTGEKLPFSTIQLGRTNRKNGCHRRLKIFYHADLWDMMFEGEGREWSTLHPLVWDGNDTHLDLASYIDVVKLMEETLEAYFLVLLCLPALERRALLNHRVWGVAAKEAAKGWNHGFKEANQAIISSERKALGRLLEALATPDSMGRLVAAVSGARTPVALRSRLDTLSKSTATLRTEGLRSGRAPEVLGMFHAITAILAWSK